MTTCGAVRIDRRHLHCSRCGAGGSKADEVIGLNDFVSPRLARTMARLSVGDSFAKANGILKDLLGVCVADETFRKRAERVAAKSQAWSEPPAEQKKRFESDENHELMVDAGKVRTIENDWRDLKVEVWTSRSAGEPCEAANWSKQRLPESTARLVHVGMGHHSKFTEHWPEQVEQLGLEPSDITVTGDGADWIWDDAKHHLPGATGILDVYHASEKLHELAASKFGSRGKNAGEWGKRATTILVNEGWKGIERLIERELSDPAKSPGYETTLRETRTYFWKKRDYLDYAGQLAKGRIIGSGMVEGEIKQLGKRLKAAGVKWRERNVVAMASLCAIFHSGQWHSFAEVAI